MPKTIALFTHTDLNILTSRIVKKKTPKNKSAPSTWGVSWVVNSKTSEETQCSEIRVQLTV